MPIVKNVCMLFLFSLLHIFSPAVVIVLWCTRAVPSWFVKVESIKEKLMANNDLTYWVPSNVKVGVVALVTVSSAGQGGCCGSGYDSLVLVCV